MLISSKVAAALRCVILFVATSIFAFPAAAVSFTGLNNQPSTSSASSSTPSVPKSTTSTSSTSAVIDPATTVTEPVVSTTDVPVSTIKAGDTLYLKITPPNIGSTTTTTLTATTTSTSTPTTTTASTATVPGIVPLPRTRIFTLDKTGVLDLPYLGRFSLAGLSEQEAVLRIKAEPLLESYTVDLKILPIEKSGVEALQPFGYSLFDSPPTTFAPAEDIPVPANYVVGANDSVVIQLFGAVNETYTLVVTREGVIDVPGIGPIVVAGLTFAELKKTIAQRAAKQLIGVNSHVTLGTLRSIRVFVMGDVVRAGSYTVSSLSTLTNALFASGGVTPVGSLREIYLKRSGRVVTKLDFYELLLKGDTSHDMRLQDGDVIFVPPIGKTAGVTGEVRRPAIYELRWEKSVKDLLLLAGGMTPAAYKKDVQLLRVGKSQDREQKDLDLEKSSAMQTLLSNGDVLVVPALLDEVEDIVRLSGYVKRPGSRSWTEGMRLTSLIPSVHALLPKPDLDYVVIRRHVPGEPLTKVFSVRLGDALARPTSPANVELVRGDEVVVFGREVEGDRQNKLAPIIAELDLQGTSASPANLVSVSGSVFESGAYPLENGMRVSDLIRAAGGMKESASTLVAELSRYERAPGMPRAIQHLDVDVTKALLGDPASDLLLYPRDYLVIKTIQDWGDQLTVTLTGEVNNPGVYPIARGETLSGVIKRAGGLTDVAFADGAVFTRLEIQQKEEAQFKALADRIERETKATIQERSDQSAHPQELGDIAVSMADILRNAKSSGRMVLDLNAVLSTDNKGGYDVTLKNGDAVFIPQKNDEVIVMGEVRKPTVQLFNKSRKLEDYLNLSGGLTSKTNPDLVYVVRANGTAAVADSGSLFSSSQVEIRPGDTIVAMLDVEKVSGLKVWRDVVGSMSGLFGLVGVTSVWDRIVGETPTSSSTQLQISVP